MIDATYLKVHRTAASLFKGNVPRHVRRIKGGMNSKRHTVCDDVGRPIIIMLSTGQVSNHRGMTMVLDDLPAAST